MEGDDQPERRGNQYKPRPPDTILKPLVQFYYSLGLSDNHIASSAAKHFDTDKYGLSATTVKRVRKEWNLRKARKQAHTLESIEPYLVALKARYPDRGSTTLWQSLRLTYSVFAPRTLVNQWLRENEPEAVQARKRRKFKRHRFWTAGLNDFWAFDQHDKWRRFGLYLHLGTEPTAGEIKWLKIWWTNSNPKLITRFYLDAVRKAGAIPLITQSDPGSENFGIANAHTFMRHRLDPSLAHTLQHRWMRKHMNIKPEIMWSILNRDWKPGFEATLQLGLDNGWYNPDNPLELLVFRWLAVPWLQAELDAWAAQFNMTPRRANRRKVLPQGIPMLISQSPAEYGVLDFKIPIPDTLVNEVEAEWAPPTHPVFELVPGAFGDKASELFTDMGSPALSQENFWVAYLSLLEHFLRYQEDHPDNISLQADALASHCASQGQLAEEGVDLLPGLQEYRAGDRLVGTGEIHVAERPQPLAAEDGGIVGYAQFTSDEEELDAGDPGLL
ncbi:hypothetical protein C2E23DRAFT_811473 [Lenzites betulinus]|nr:hypothetical protein C2E23DRAFT_811473 [Lenzites betulinus]